MNIYVHGEAEKLRKFFSGKMFIKHVKIVENDWKKNQKLS